MSNRKFHLSTVTLQFIREEPFPESWGVEEMIYDAINGESSMMQVDPEGDTVVDAKKAVGILLEQGSDPSFFRLTLDGEDIE